MEYYLNERLRLINISEPDNDLEHAKKLVEWIRKKKLNTITLPDVYQSGPNQIRNKQQAQKIIRILEDHLWLKKVKSKGKSQLTGKNSNDIWEVNDSTSGKCYGITYFEGKSGRKGQVCKKTECPWIDKITGK